VRARIFNSLLFIQEVGCVGCYRMINCDILRLKDHSP
jgi:hypothetical protein